MKKSNIKSKICGFIASNRIFIKKTIICMSCLLFASWIFGCDIRKIFIIPTIEIGESTQFSQDEIDKAISIVKREFSFSGKTLTKICYDEEQSNQLVKTYLDNEDDLNKKYKPENMIGLLTDFDTDGSGREPSFNLNCTYTDYAWTLVRDDKDSDWRIMSWGY